MYTHYLFTDDEHECCNYYIKHDGRLVLAIGITKQSVPLVTSVHVKKIKSGYYQIRVCKNNQRRATWSATVHGNREEAYCARDLLYEILVLIPSTQAKLLANTDCSVAI